MLNIEVIKFEAQDVITTSVAAPTEAPTEPPVQEPEVTPVPDGCTCTVEAGIPQWALDIHGGQNGHGSCPYTGELTHLCGKN